MNISTAFQVFVFETAELTHPFSSRLTFTVSHTSAKHKPPSCVADQLVVVSSVSKLLDTDPLANPLKRVFFNGNGAPNASKGFRCLQNRQCW